MFSTRKTIKKIAKAADHYDIRISHVAWLTISAQRGPSTIGTLQHNKLHPANTLLLAFVASHRQFHTWINTPPSNWSPPQPTYTTTVAKAGLMFEVYMDVCSGFTQHRLYMENTAARNERQWRGGPNWQTIKVPFLTPTPHPYIRGFPTYCWVKSLNKFIDTLTTQWNISMQTSSINLFKDFQNLIPEIFK